MKKTILYSLFVVSSINFSLCPQDALMQDEHEDLLLVFDDGLEENHPFEAIDTNLKITPKMQKSIHDLELDPMVHIDILVETDDEFVVSDSMFDEALGEVSVPEMIEDIIIDSAVIPHAPQDIIILDATEEQTEDIIVSDLATDDTITCQIVDANIAENIQPLGDTDSEELQVYPIQKNQLEDLLEMQCQQIGKYLFDVATASSGPQRENNTTTSIDDVDAMVASDNGLTLDAESTMNENSLHEDDDIIPVPHDLINSVKKATKQKKKLEKKEKALLRKAKNKRKKNSVQ